MHIPNHRDDSETEVLDDCINDIVAKVALTAWRAGLSHDDLLGLNRIALISFCQQHRISREEMNLACAELRWRASGRYKSQSDRGFLFVYRCR